MKLHPTGSLVLALLAIAGCEGSRATDQGSDAMPERAAAGATAAFAPEAREATATSKTEYSRDQGVRLSASQAASPALPNAASMTDSTPVLMIIRTGNASIEVDSLDAGMAAVRGLAERLGGYIANTSLQAGREQTHSATLEMKIPAARFDEALSGLGPIGKLESAGVSAADVSEEFVDVSARVANARRLEQRLIELLATRTGKLSEVLQVERELARIRGGIEQSEGRLRFLRARAAMSTLSVTVHEPVPIIGQSGSGGVIAQSFRQSWSNFVSFVAGCIAALGTLVPLALILFAAGLAAVKVARRLRHSGEVIVKPRAG